MKKFLTVSAFAVAGIAAAAMVDDDFRDVIVDTAKNIGGAIKEKISPSDSIDSEPDEEPEDPFGPIDEADEDAPVEYPDRNPDPDLVGHDIPSPTVETEAVEESGSFDLK